MANKFYLLSFGPFRASRPSMTLHLPWQSLSTHTLAIAAHVRSQIVDTVRMVAQFMHFKC